MGVIRELFELCTPNLDRERLFSLVPVDLRSAASELEIRIKRTKDEVPSSQLDAAALCTTGCWLLLLAEDGAAPLRQHEIQLIGRIMNRQHFVGYCEYGATIAQRYAIPHARPHMRDPNSSERIKAFEECRAEEEWWSALATGQTDSGPLPVTPGPVFAFKEGSFTTINDRRIFEPETRTA
jgi:hypothetical protein